MDDLDRMLDDLPQEPVPPNLAGSVRAAVRRRHRRQLLMRRAVGATLAAMGVWLLWPGLAWISSGELFASGTPWLMGGLDSLNSQSLDLLSRVWNGTVSMQGAVGSDLALSILLGAVFVCCSIFLGIDRAAWQPKPVRRSMQGGRALSASGIHL